MTDPTTIATLLHSLWGSLGELTFTVILTTFLMLLLKEFATDLFYYITTKMSDIGKGALIIWNGKKVMVDKVHFRRIEVYDNEEVTFIPIRLWVSSTKTFVNPTKGSFRE